MDPKSINTFGDTVNRIGDSSRSGAEVAAIVARLLNAGRGRMHGHCEGKRVGVRPPLDTFPHWVRS